MVQADESTVDRLMREDEVAEYFDIARQTVANWRYEKRGPRFIKLGKGRPAPVRYWRSELLKYAADPDGYEQRKGNAKPSRRRKSRR